MFIFQCTTCTADAWKKIKDQKVVSGVVGGCSSDEPIMKLLCGSGTPLWVRIRVRVRIRIRIRDSSVGQDQGLLCGYSQ